MLPKDSFYKSKGFQFYDSPIKREAAEAERIEKERFNSMIVRLKGRILLHRRPCGNGFQFYDSPIKRACPSAG